MRTSFFCQYLHTPTSFFLPVLTRVDRLHRSTSLEQPLTADVDVTKTTFHRAQESQGGVCIQHVIFSTLLSPLRRGCCGPSTVRDCSALREKPVGGVSEARGYCAASGRDDFIRHLCNLGRNHGGHTRRAALEHVHSILVEAAAYPGPASTCSWRCRSWFRLRRRRRGTRPRSMRCLFGRRRCRDDHIEEM